MAVTEKREVFSILQDVSTLEGAAPARATEGAAVSGNEMPVLPSKDLAGNWQHIPSRAEADAVDALNVPVLGAKTFDGKLAYIPLNSDGAVIVSGEGGTAVDNAGTATPSGNGSDTTVVSLTLDPDGNYNDIEAQGSCTFTTLWTLKQTDDVTVTTLGQFITGPGQFTAKIDMKQRRTAGSSGLQNLTLIGNQQNGPNTPMHGIISAFKAS